MNSDYDASKDLSKEMTDFSSRIETKSSAESSDSADDKSTPIHSSASTIASTTLTSCNITKSRQRVRTPSAVMLAKLESDQLTSHKKQKERTRVKRTYNKRQTKTSAEDNLSLLSKNGSLSMCTTVDESTSSSEEEIDFTCCLCMSDRDYSEFSEFPKQSNCEESKLNLKKLSAKEKDDQVFKNDKVQLDKLPNHAKEDIDLMERASITEVEKDNAERKQMNRYDPHNSLIICDTPSCNRVYHQHCHFTPIFAIPRGPWYCLVCIYSQQYQNQRLPLPATMQNNMLPKTPKKRGRPRKNTSPSAKRGLFPLKSILPFFPKDKIYPPPMDPTCQIKKTLSSDDFQLPSTLLISTNQAQNALTTPDDSVILQFEKHSSELKISIIEQNLSKLRSAVSQCLIRIRTCENAIRIYTESDRSRKELLLAATQKRCLPAELVLSKHKLMNNQWRIRSLLDSLKNYIKYGGSSNGPRGRSEPRCEEEDETDSESGRDDESNLSVKIKQEKNNLDQLCKSKVGTSIINEAEEESIIACTICFSSESTEKNDILLCDGLDCCRAFHMECLKPKVTQEDLQNDPDDTWFCPYCTSLGKLIDSVQHEYYGDDKDAMGDEWEDVDDVFKGLEDEMKAWGLGRDGSRNIEVKKGMVISKKATLKLLGMDEVVDNDEEDDEDDDEDYNDAVPSKANSDDDSESSGSLDDISSIESQIEKSEILALKSGSESESESDESSLEVEDSMRPMRRRRRRKDGSPNKVPDGDTDVGTLDERNIIRGKRNRTKVDYRRLNDSMFGQLQENEAAKMFGDEKNDEYESSAGSSIDDAPNGEGKVKQKNKRGRPKKLGQSITPTVTKRKRGRPPKNTSKQQTKQDLASKGEKRRGRPPKLKTRMEKMKKESSDQFDAGRSIDSNEPKKKRGRPRKVDVKHDENSSNRMSSILSLNLPQPKKKRGRPPKKKIVDIDDNAPISSFISTKTKKRGRPPKNKQMPNNDKSESTMKPTGIIAPIEMLKSSAEPLMNNGYNASIYIQNVPVSIPVQNIPCVNPFPSNSNGLDKNINVVEQKLLSDVIKKENNSPNAKKDNMTLRAASTKGNSSPNDGKIKLQ